MTTGFGPSIPVLFYLDSKYVGEAELPQYFGGTRWMESPESHHYFDPVDGRIWASIEILGREWSSWRIPSVDQRHPSVARRVRGLHLDWLFGSNFYNHEGNLLYLPRAILELEYRCAEYNLDNNVF
jgi:hypothetical protein